MSQIHDRHDQRRIIGIRRELAYERLVTLRESMGNRFRYDSEKNQSQSRQQK